MSRSTSVIPGFGLTLGYTLVYLSLLVLIPLGALFLKTTELSWAQFIAIVSAPVIARAVPAPSLEIRNRVSVVDAKRR